MKEGKGKSAGWGVPLELSSRAGLDDGAWHRFHLRVDRDEAVLLLDGIVANATSLPFHSVPNVHPIKVPALPR